jgi:hypothetical protein
MSRRHAGSFRRFCRFPKGRGLAPILWGLAFGVCFAAPAFSRPAPLPAQEPNFTLEGKISDLAPGKFTVSTQDNIIFHVRYTDKTHITRADGSPGSPKDFKVGVSVHVAGDLEESGEINAAEIRVLAGSNSQGPHEPPPGEEGHSSPSGNSLPLP